MGMKVEYLSPLRPEFCLNKNRGRCWRLAEPFFFSVDGEKYEAPVGFWTDFASVPRLAWSIISPYDLGVGPVPHDLGYFTGWKTKAYWDEVFEACMLMDNVPAWKRRVAYRAVDLFGGWTWDSYRERSPYKIGKIVSQGLRVVVDSRTSLRWGEDSPRTSGWTELAPEPAGRLWLGRLAALTPAVAAAGRR